MPSNLTRRTFVAAASAAAVVPAHQAAAITDAAAKALVGRCVADINRIINSGKSERGMIRDFGGVFRSYGDVPIIARSALGADARRASPAQLRAVADAFSGFLAQKYGRRFREFIGGQIQVQGSRQVRDYWEVITVTKLQGQSPFQVVFRVSDKSGQDRFFDIVIEGISLLKTERTEIGALLDRRRGNIDALIADLKAAA